MTEFHTEVEAIFYANHVFNVNLQLLVPEYFLSNTVSDITHAKRL